MSIKLKLFHTKKSKERVPSTDFLNVCFECCGVLRPARLMIPGAPIDDSWEPGTFTKLP